MKTRDQLLKIGLTIAMAAAPLANGWAQNSQASPQASQSSSTGGATYVAPQALATPTPRPLQPSAVGGGAAQAARDSQRTQAIAMIASTVAGGYYLSRCKWKWHFCVMGALAISQAGSLAGTSRGAGDAATYVSTDASVATATGNTQAETSCLGAGCFNDSDPNGTSGLRRPAGEGNSELTSLLGAAQAEYDALSKELEKAGVEVSKDGSKVKLPDGRVVSTANMDSIDGMKAAGFSDLEIAEVKASMAEMQAKVRERVRAAALAAGAAAGSGGGGTIVRPGGGDEGAGGANGAMRGLAGMFGAPKKSAQGKVSGMSKQLGDDRIGVSADDIFEMIKRRYQERDAANAFLKN